MADAILSFVVERIGNLLIDEAVFLSEVKEQVGWVRDELRAMKCFLKDAEEKSGGDESVMNWVMDVRGTAYSAEDLVELFVLHARQRRQKGALRWTCLPCDLHTLHKFGEEIRQLRGKIRDIDERRIRYGIQRLPGEANRQVDERVRERRRIVLHARDGDLVGMNEETARVLNHLLDKGRKIRSVISIVGMGGIGKSTLAKRVFNGAKAQFVYSVWITVSQNYSVDVLLKDLLCQLTSSKAEDIEKMRREEREEKIHGALSQKKYLIVLDDVWKGDVWEILRPHLPDAEIGSRVLITTRSLDVARAANPSEPPHELRVLNKEESWELLSKKAFPNQDIEAVCSEEMKEVGKQIANKCGGLPLALVVLGGLLSSKGHSLDRWRKLANTMEWNHSEDGRLCLDILKLSYADLPHHLKWCFLYFSSLPEDFEIEVEKLIRLWMAEGFVAQREGETLEESGMGYLEELQQRCMVTLVEYRDDRISKKVCRIHDVLHDFVIAEAKETGFFQRLRNPDGQHLYPVDCSTRRLSLHGVTDDSKVLVNGIPKVRTLLLFTGYDSERVHIPFLELKLLRVLDLAGCCLDDLPKQVGELIHLRYLGLGELMISSLPSSLGNLHHLQCLEIKSSWIKRVPAAMLKISALRCISLYSMRISEVDGPDLRNLQVLKAVESGEWIGRYLHTFVTLRELAITGIEERHHRALESSIPHLSSLKTLSLDGGRIPWCFGELSSLESLYLSGRLIRPRLSGSGGSYWPPSLVHVSLYGTEIEEQDTIEALGNLAELRLLELYFDAYIGRELIFSYRKFPQLQSLLLDELEELERWVIEPGAMPCLERLEIKACQKLATIPEGLQHSTALKELVISEMAPELHSRIRGPEGEDWPEIQHVHSIKISEYLLSKDPEDHIIFHDN